MEALTLTEVAIKIVVFNENFNGKKQAQINKLLNST